MQARLIVVVAGIVSLLLVLIALVVSTLLGRELELQLEQQVESSLQQVNQEVYTQTLWATSSASDILMRISHSPGTLLIVDGPLGTTGAYNVNGQVRPLTSLQLAPLSTGYTSTTTRDVTLVGSGGYRIAGLATDRYTLVLGLPRSGVEQTIGSLWTMIAALTVIGLVVLSVATILVVRAGMRPLRAVADTATRVSRMRLDSGDVTIGERVPVTHEQTEIGRVGAAMNTLLDHIDESLAARHRNEERMRQFVADASHELRTPLAAIRGYSELSLRDPSLGDGTASALERIQAQSVRMTTLVEDLLLLARLDEGQELVFGSVDLGRLALETSSDARVAGPHHIWQVDVPDEPVLLAGDAPRLHQVVANLLANARAHTPAGTVVTVSVEKDGRDAVLRVHDDGPGIDPSVQETLFERFARGDRSRARRTGGTGLGLAIAKAIIDAHGGSITVRSEPGDTVFELRLAARPDDPPAVTTAPTLLERLRTGPVKTTTGPTPRAD